MGALFATAAPACTRVLGGWQKVQRVVGRQPATWGLLIALVAYANYQAPHELIFAPFYLVPILGAAWYLARHWVMGATAYAASCFLLVGYLKAPEFTPTQVLWWNGTARVLMFGAAGLLLNRVREHQQREKRLMQFVVHDLRSPQMALELTLQKLALDSLEPATTKGLKQCQHLVHRLRSLTDNLLDLARKEVDSPVALIRPFLLNPLILEVLETFRAVQERSGTRVQVLPVLPGTTVQGDRQNTERVLENILGNAFKASPAGGTIVLQVATEAPGFLRLGLSDQGPGIPGKLLESVFDPYVQVDQTRDAALGGCGLGLAFCKWAVEAQGGKIWIACPPQGGTTVFLTLKLAEMGNLTHSDSAPFTFKGGPLSQVE